MSTLTNDIVSIDVDNTENWTVIIEDTDLSGNPIAHTGDTLHADVKDASGNIVFSADTGDELSLVGGSTNQIQLSVPWNIVSTLEAATYYVSLVIIKDANNREKILDLELRHSVL
jgi:hypothetical protein